MRGRPIEEDREEVRFALVMTGGVSLAVWMGGVATELNRLIGGEGWYGELLDLTRSTARVDVIGGTSAGGVNGAFLAAAIAHRKDVAHLRSVWLELGALTSLLRSPREDDPPSLLRGDDYFLPALRRVFEDLSGSPTDPAEVPIHLILTTTLLSGEARTFQDDYGARIRDLSHRATFTFRRGNGADVDDFASPGAAGRLALAARSTASFPGAFEPSFCPVGGPGPDDHHPDMGEHVDFRSSSYLIDGGVLMNKPLRPVLRAIFTRQTEGHGRRVLMYVVPDPDLPAARRPPGTLSMTRVVTDSMQIPRVESVFEDLESIRDHNQRVLAQRRLRESLLGRDRAGGSSGAGGEEARRPVDLVDLAGQLFPAYLGARREYTVRQAIDELARGLRLPGAGEADAAAAADEPGEGRPRRRRRLWDPRRVRLALLEALEPTLPSGVPPDDLEGWAWDPTAVETVIATTSHVLRLGLELTAPSEAGAGDVRAELLSRLAGVRRVRRSLRLLRRREMTYWRHERARTVRAALASDGRGPAPGPALVGWAADTVAGRPVGEASRADLFAMAWTVAGAMVAVRKDLRRVAAGAIGHDWGDDATAGLLLDMLDRLSPPDRGGADAPTGSGEDRDVERTLRRLLALVVVESALAGGEPVVEQLVELMQISAEAPNAFDERDTGPEKLAGLQLGHFGAFYKRSWRANDWMWGRLDAIPSLLRVLLNPARLRHLAANDPSFASELGERIRRLALAEDDGEAAAVLRPAWDEAAVREELAFVGDPARPLPVALPACTAALIRRIQLAILQEELPCVAAAVRADLLNGATDRDDARAFLEAVHAAQAGDRAASAGAGDDAPPAGIADRAAPVGPARPRRSSPPDVREDLPLAPAAAARLLAACRVGRERFSEESQSSLYLSTVNAATAVGLRAAQRHVAGSVPERRGRASIRRSWPAVSPVIGSMAARSVRVLLAMAVLLAAGAALLAVGLRGDVPGALATGAGSLLLAAGAILAVARTRPGLRAVPMAGAAVAAILLLLSLMLPGHGDVRSGAFRVAVVVVLVVLLAVIGGGAPPRRRSRD